MQVVSSIHELYEAGFKRVSIACGNFDGLHLGHRKIIDQLLVAAKESNSEPVVLTFSPHPRLVLTGKQFPILAPMKTKVRLFEALGVKAIININFTKEFASQTASDFVKNVLLQEGLEVRDICVGSDWRFGSGREGNVEFLKDKLWGFKVYPIAELEDSDEFISSSRIRTALAENDFVLTKKLLGRDYSVRGKVVQGAGIATKQLNYPTANVDVQEQCLPLAGVFACCVAVGDQPKLHNAVCNIGSAPTFNDSQKMKVEVHLLDYSGNLYGEELEIFFMQFLRSEKKFSCADELKKQISNDVAKAREIFE
ncbi:MAG: riboflavin biosynthesis protein RibF [Lentisphaerales bacterium]|nr:riboflavin biosynthesis protein RibF [Lentisphaerales bacterium]